MYSFCVKTFVGFPCLGALCTPFPHGTIAVPATLPQPAVLIVNQISYGAVKFWLCMYWHPRKELCNY